LLLKSSILVPHSAQYSDVPGSALPDSSCSLPHSSVFYPYSQTSSIRYRGILLCLFLLASGYLTAQKTYSDENLGQHTENLLFLLLLKSPENLSGLLLLMRQSKG